MVRHEETEMDSLIIGIGVLIGLGALSLVFRFVARKKTGRSENNPQDDIYPMW
jgi:hypothetical protein